jgi:large subunit ribosomal protein L30
MAKAQVEGSMKITLVRSVIGYNRAVRETVVSLGLGKLNGSVIQPKTPDILGKVRRIAHLVTIEDVQ